MTNSAEKGGGGLMSEMNWREWLEARRADATMETEQIPIEELVDEECQGWHLSPNAFERGDGKFFQLIGAKVSVPKPGEREVLSWKQPLLKEVGSGGVVLVVSEQEGEMVFLIRAKTEPGNLPEDSCTMLAPTVQASRSNLEQAHGGKRPPRAELLDEREYEIVDLVQDGGRYFRKVNGGVIVYLEDPAEIGSLDEYERWFTRRELREAAFAGATNQHLREIGFLAVI